MLCGYVYTVVLSTGRRTKDLAIISNPSVVQRGKADKKNGVMWVCIYSGFKHRI